MGKKGQKKKVWLHRPLPWSVTLQYSLNKGKCGVCWNSCSWVLLISCVLEEYCAFQSTEYCHETLRVHIWKGSLKWSVREKKKEEMLCSGLHVNYTVSCKRTNAHSWHIVLFVAITGKDNKICIIFNKQRKNLLN